MKIKLKFYEKILNGEKKKEFRIEKLNLPEKYQQYENNQDVDINNLASFHKAERDYTALDFGDGKYFLLRKAWSIGTAESAYRYMEEYQKYIDTDSYNYCMEILIPKMKEDKNIVFVIYAVYECKLEKAELIF